MLWCMPWQLAHHLFVNNQTLELVQGGCLLLDIGLSLEQQGLKPLVPTELRTAIAL
jgi:hypothetical protein